MWKASGQVSACHAVGLAEAVVRCSVVRKEKVENLVIVIVIVVVIEILRRCGVERRMSRMTRMLVGGSESVFRGGV